MTTSDGASTRFAVLLSGGGTNLQAILDFWARAPAAYPTDRAELALVVSNRPGAGGLARAERAGIPTAVVDHRLYRGDRAAFEAALEAELRRRGVEWLVLAGWMRIFTAPFVGRWSGRILNTHPALLPSFPGNDGAGMAIAAGVKVSGCTIHFVDEGVDTGPIIAQAAVPVLESDDAHTLVERIKRVEHALYPKVVAKVLAGRYRVDGRVVHLEGGGP